MQPCCCQHAGASYRPDFALPSPSRRMNMPLAAMSPNNVAVVTGGASGIGLAAAMRFAKAGMKVCIADIVTERLAEAATKLSSVARGGQDSVMTAAIDVSHSDAVMEL